MALDGGELGVEAQAAVGLLVGGDADQADHQRSFHRAWLALGDVVGSVHLSVSAFDVGLNER